MANEISNPRRDQFIRSAQDKYGVQDTIDVIVFGFSIGEAIQDSKEEDGDVDWKDAPKFFNPALKLPKAIMGIENVPKELGELSDQDRQTIEAKVIELIPVATPANVREIINLSLEAVFVFVKLGGKIVELKKRKAA